MLEELLPDIDNCQPTADSPRVLDLFCGAGGMALGFISAGFRIVAGIERDTDAALTFKRNIPYFQGLECDVRSGPVDGDLEALNPAEVLKQIGPCDVIIGGPPCKAFSKVGRGKLNSLSDEGFADDPRNKLYQKFRQFLAVFQPKAFVMENVPGMLSVRGQNVAHRAALELSTPDDGPEPLYEVRYALLDASWFGAPQFRQRLIFIGIRKDLDVEPTMPARWMKPQFVPGTGYMEWQTEGMQEELFGGLLRANFAVPVPQLVQQLGTVSVAEALDDLPMITAHLSNKDFGRHKNWRQVLPYRQDDKLHAFARLMRDWDGPTSTRATGASANFIRNTRRDFETFRRMKPGDRYPDAHKIALLRYDEAKKDLMSQGMVDKSQLKRLKGSIVPPYPVDRGFEDRWKKLKPSHPSWTVTAHLAHDTYSHIHHDSEQARAISVREAARLQTFPDRFQLGPEGGLSSAYAQIGNAVPPLLGYAVAKHLKGLLSENGP